MRHFTFRPFLRIGILAAVAVLALDLPAVAQVSGGIFTTDSTGSGVNLNLYGSKEEVYLDGGPQKIGAAGLPPGLYYVQVTEPNGTLLGSSVFASTPTPVRVTAEGEFAAYYQLSAILMTASNHHKRGYDTTSNPGGEYKVWVSKDPTFANSESKTDNFKVKKKKGPLPPPAQMEIRACKFYDLDRNGTWGDWAAEPPISNWRIELFRTSDHVEVGCALTDGGGEVRFLVDRDGTTHYTVVEVLVEPYIPTTPVSFEIVANQDLCLVYFGNIALGPAEVGLGRTPGFWQNQNGEAILASNDPAWRGLVNSLSVVWPDGTPLTIPDGATFPDAFSLFAGWIVGTGADGNMAYILSRQLVATALNVAFGPMSGFPAVYVTWGGQLVNLKAVFLEAVALLELYPLTPGSDPSVAGPRAQQEAIKTFLDAINNNLEPVRGELPGQVPFTPAPCTGT